MEAGEDLSQAIARSFSGTENVEHIFANVPAGDYEIVVTQFSGDDQHFGLAWRFGNPSPTITPGDYDEDDDVDGVDFLQWQRGQSPNPLSAGDLADWQTNYGAGPLSAAAAVPEPSCLALLFPLALLLRTRNAV